ncbi:MAG: hypothetical protein Fur003_4120 [Candidatus Dojkabacteria bacterium]
MSSTLDDTHSNMRPKTKTTAALTTFLLLTLACKQNAPNNSLQAPIPSSEAERVTLPNESFCYFGTESDYIQASLRNAQLGDGSLFISPNFSYDAESLNNGKGVKCFFELDNKIYQFLSVGDIKLSVVDQQGDPIPEDIAEEILGQIASSSKFVGLEGAFLIAEMEPENLSGSIFLGPDGTATVMGLIEEN